MSLFNKLFKKKEEIIKNDINDDEKIESNDEIQKEKIEYQYPDLNLIKDENLKLAIENTPDSGILNIPLGIDNNGNWLYYDITKMPNLLIGGTVMSGKTNMINLILLGLISKYSNNEIKIVIADSKGVDYLVYNDEPHLLIPVLNDEKKLISVLEKEIVEMESRYLLLQEYEIKNVYNYNKIHEEFKMPYHLIFIDDYVSFACNYANELNLCIEKLTRNGWNVGIHVIIVASHPTNNILSSISKLNFRTRISFSVPSIKDSRMILESSGAEKITGIGNALINSNLNSEIKLIHINLVDDNDILRIVKDLSNKNVMKYSFKKIDELLIDNKNVDVLYDEIFNYAIRMGQISASLIQRKYSIGYNRAARIMDTFEERGIIGPAKGSKPRDILVKYDENE